MTSIGSLLDEQTRTKLQGVTAKVSKDEPAIVVIKAATDPNPPRRLTMADAIEIDPESEAMIDATCVDCGVPMLIDPKVPEGVDPAMPRVPICEKDAKVRAQFAAINEQRKVEIRRRNAEHERRMTQHTEEKPMPQIDLNTMSKAEIGTVVVDSLRAEAAQEIKKKAKKAKKVKAAKEAKAKEGVRAEQKRRKAQGVLPAFMVGTTLEVPALDLSDVASLDEAPSAKERSPYNKARFRLVHQGPLDPEETTYRTLESEHKRLMELAEEHNSWAAKKAEEEAAKPKKTKKAKTEAVVAVIDEDEQAAIERKVKALAKATGISKKAARKIVVGV